MWAEKSSTHPKNEKTFLKFAQNGYICQYVNNHYTKFEYKGMKTFGVADYTN